MVLTMSARLAAGYKSRSQMARVVTEDWAARHLYCPACSDERLQQSSANTRAVDFCCGTCKAAYQLKGRARWDERRVADAGYEAMVRAIRSNSTPNLLVMQYSNDWVVRNLLLVPSFFFIESAIEKRRPLATTARRAGWIGCNILLEAIAPEGKLRIVDEGVAVDPAIVRAWYQHVQPLADLSVNVRGWTLDVLRLIRRLGREKFALGDLYAQEARLAVLHPNNNNIRAKVRQQLQILRDLGFIDFLGSGKYSIPEYHRYKFGRDNA